MKLNLVDLDMWRCVLPLALFAGQALVRGFYVPPWRLTSSTFKTSRINYVASAARRTCKTCSLGPLHASAREREPSASTTTSGDDVVDVAIVGAGPAGLALASPRGVVTLEEFVSQGVLERTCSPTSPGCVSDLVPISLRDKGCRVKVFEAVKEIQERGAAVFVQSIGLAALEEIKPGLAAEAIEVGRPTKSIHLTRSDGSTIAQVDMAALEELIGYPFLAITRYCLQRVLLTHLPDDVVQLGYRLEGIDDGGSRGLTELRFEGHSQPVLARAVVGADGRRSAVRKQILAPNEKSNDWALTWWALADVKDSPVPVGEFRMAYAKRQAMYFGEVQDGLTMWSCTTWQEGEIERNPELRGARALQAMEGWPEQVTDMVKSTPPSRLIEVYIGDSPLQWFTWSRRRGATLVGDAAHAMLPTLGMGVTSAFQDVVALAGCVDGPETPMAEAFVEYERQRRIPATLVQLASRIGMFVIEKILCR